MAAGMPRSPPSTPMPVIASISTCAREMIDSAVSNRSPASPAEKSLAQPGIRARGSSTSTLPPARTIAANADSCSDLPTATAVTEAPASARRAAAYRPSPPLSPAPASTTTRASDRSMPSSSSRRAAILGHRARGHAQSAARRHPAGGVPERAPWRRHMPSEAVSRGDPRPDPVPCMSPFTSVSVGHHFTPAAPASAHRAAAQRDARPPTSIGARRHPPAHAMRRMPVE